MKRKDFYIEYYRRTNRRYSDKIIWGEKESKEADRKGQYHTSKIGRVYHIIIQYAITIFLCLVPFCLDGSWFAIPFAVLLFWMQTLYTNFSIIKIEVLYSIYRKDNAYCSVLHDIFLDICPEFLNRLKQETKKKVTGYVLHRGGTLYAKYSAICRKRDNILLTFKSNKVIISVDEKKFVIDDKTLAKEQLLTEIAALINEEG